MGGARQVESVAKFWLELFTKYVALFFNPKWVKSAVFDFIEQADGELVLNAVVHIELAERTFIRPHLMNDLKK